MKAKSLCLVASLLLLGAVARAQASPVDVSYALSGSPGNWLYDFAVTNNISSNLDIYGVQFFLPNPSPSSSPPNWVPQTFPGSVQWCDFNCSFQGGLAFGETLSGFVVLDTSLTAQSSVQWLIAAIDPASCVVYLCSNNPVITGEASSTPLPAALPLFATGLGALGLLGWRRQRKAAAAIAAA